MRGPRVIQVIESESWSVNGVIVRQYHTLDGEFLAESKPTAAPADSKVEVKHESTNVKHESTNVTATEPSTEDLVAEMTAKLEKAAR